MSIISPFPGIGSGPTPTSTDLKRLSPIALAYLGDAVYELYIRAAFLWPPQRLQDHHRQVVAKVRAEEQARALQALIPHLTPGEQDIIRRGRNAAVAHSRRVDPATYQQATGFEALVGYLYLSDPERLLQLLDQLR